MGLICMIGGKDLGIKMYLKIYLVYLLCLPVCNPAMTAPSTIKEWWQDNGETSLSSYGDKYEMSPCFIGWHETCW